MEQIIELLERRGELSLAEELRDIVVAWRNRIGFWRSKSREGRAREISRYIDPKWKGTKEYKAVISYLRGGRPLRRYKGRAVCALCGKRLGSSDRVTPDGKWVFPAGYSHYLSRHGVKPHKPAFIKDALSYMKKKKAR